MSPFTDGDGDPNPNETGGPAPDPLATISGFNVLATRHNMRDAIAAAFPRVGEMVESAGTRAWYDHAGLPAPTRNFQWTASDRTAANALRTFLSQCRGRLVPFWVPTFVKDFTLKTPAGSSDTVLQMVRTGYLENLWPNPGRRYVAISTPAGIVTRKITAAAAVDATTESITLASAAGSALTADNLISFLLFCRLANDDTEIRWFSTWGCEATIEFVELPREVPA